jgi:hypothetical protein
VLVVGQRLAAVLAEPGVGVVALGQAIRARARRDRPRDRRAVISAVTIPRKRHAPAGRPKRAAASDCAIEAADGEVGADSEVFMNCATPS